MFYVLNLKKKIEAKMARVSLWNLFVKIHRKCHQYWCIFGLIVRIWRLGISSTFVEFRHELVIYLELAFRQN